MPTYEYACQKCGHQFEKFQPIADQALRTCPKDLCKLKTWGKGKVKKVIGAGAGLIFKGSGFYITDYRSESYKAAAKKESSAGESKPSSGAESSGAKKETPKSTPGTPGKKKE
jgi:putative FmdB family regulatory protein